ncbi:unnamed protein product [Ostreobium quekettii]|uniref:Protein CLP1 homolog n=1 Tax=Ostreobium quekettii TaxID=121088 RepID=A0A8S1IK01_9CHLO|nr:unnamed protein product [Ostreobium quekettii]|eukprot:evm.model.scf_1059.8 EVM.evm.TU.scf_1059.8   scf_1059:47812-51791(-)
MTLRELSLAKQHELRVEVLPDKKLTVGLRRGDAEIFGAQIGLGEKVTIHGQKIAIFTYGGCLLELDGDAEVMYTSEETPMEAYINVHNVFENQRTKAQSNGGQGPRVMVVGPTDSGKSTLCRILINYALRLGWSPTFVDLDIGQGSIAPPGTIAATPVQLPVTVEDGYPLDVPLVFYFGHTTPVQNANLYKFQVERMATLLDRRANRHPTVAASGMLVNTMGWVEGLGYELILHAIKALKVDNVLVVGQERLHSQLESDLRQARNPRIQVLRLPKSGGVVTRSPETRRADRASRVRDYFYGVPRTLMPHSETIQSTELNIYRVGGGRQAQSSIRPAGTASLMNPLKITPVRVGNEISNCLLGVSHARTAEEILSVSVAGFIFIQRVDVRDDGEGTVTYLAPGPGSLPGRYLLLGSIEILNFT